MPTKEKGPLVAQFDLCEWTFPPTHVTPCVSWTDLRLSDPHHQRRGRQAARAPRDFECTEFGQGGNWQTNTGIYCLFREGTTSLSPFLGHPPENANSRRKTKNLRVSKGIKELGSNLGPDLGGWFRTGSFASIPSEVPTDFTDSSVPLALQPCGRRRPPCCGPKPFVKFLSD